MKFKFSTNFPLLISLVTAITMVATEAPNWILAFCLLAIVYKIASEILGVNTVSRRWTALFSIVIAAEVFLHFGGIFNQEASTTLILGLTALKIVDYENERDMKFLFLLGVLLLALKPLYSIDIYWLIPTLISFILLWWSLYTTFSPSQPRFLTRLFIGSIPMTVLLFLIFPRWVVPWAQTKSGKNDLVGFSDQLNPGAVAGLALSNRIAFRVHFEESLEFSSKSLYWRGAVLTKSSGLAWSAPKEKSQFADDTFPFSAIQYQVILEPDNHTFLFGLERTFTMKSASTNVLQSANDVFHASARPNTQISYEGYASVLSKDTTPPTTEMSEMPKFPERTELWIEKTKKSEKSPEKRIEALKKFFSDGSFTYSISPGTYKEGDLDEFLFVRRLGFCEHFAGAYASLARGLGIPSRVVTGYQGGTYNKFGEFWKISSRDAHAWAEIFTEGSWQRVDPTSFVAPLRVELGADAYFDLSEEDRVNFGSQGLKKRTAPFYSLWYDQTTHFIDDLNYRWTSFLLDFNKGSQDEIWRDVKKNIGWILLSIAIVTLATTFTRRFIRRAPKENDVYKIIYADLFAWGEGHQLPRNPDDTPLQYCQKVAAKFPQLESFLNKLSHEYDKRTYQMVEPPLTVGKQLQKDWKKLRRDQNRA